MAVGGRGNAAAATSRTEEKCTVRRNYLYVSAIALGSLFCSVAPTQAQAPMGSPPASPTPQRPRIALVNIAKVLREFQKANADGQLITKKRQAYIDQIKPLREKLADLSKKSQLTPNPAEKEKLQKDALAV